MGFLEIITVVVCALVIIDAQTVDLPENVKTCKKDSSDYSSCLRLAIQEAWPTFSRGIPELNVPSLEPYEFEVPVHQYQTNEISGRMSIRNGKSWGLGRARFLSVRPYHEKDYFRLDIDYEMPKAFLDGDYKFEGSMGQMRAGGKGHFNVSLTDVRSMLVIEGPVVNDRWVIEKVSLTPEVGNLKVWASDLFNGNEVLTRAALAFVNEYWEIMYRVMLPFAAKAWNASLKELINGIFANLSFSNTFP